MFNNINFLLLLQQNKMQHRVRSFYHVGDKTNTAAAGLEIAFGDNKSAHNRIFENSVLDANVRDASVEGGMVNVETHPGRDGRRHGCWRRGGR